MLLNLAKNYFHMDIDGVFSDSVRVGELILCGKGSETDGPPYNQQYLQQFP